MQILIRNVMFLFGWTVLVWSSVASNLDELVRPGVKVEKLADGFGFGEGPAWHEGEQALYFSDLKNKTLHRWEEKEGVSTIREGGEVFTNGIVVDSDGRLVFCETGAYRVLRREADGSETVLFDRVGDQRLGLTNDLWMSRNGGLYVTIPNKAGANDRFKKEKRLLGTIVYRAPDGTTKDVGAAIGVKAPNGIVGRADGRRLYFRDGGTCRVAEILSDGSLAEAKVAAPTGTDGLTLDERGNLYTTSREGVEIFAPDASRIGLIPVPETPANLTFGGADGRTLFITARTSLYSIPMKVRGDAFAHNAEIGETNERKGVKMANSATRKTIEPFLSQHCYECHDDLSEDGDLNLLDLSFDPTDPGNLERWVAVLDRVEAGEMPPEKKPRPEVEQLKSFLAHLEEPLAEADLAMVREQGRARPRRLNRSEFETALEDLLGMPLHIEENLPEDAKSHGFETVGEALNVSSVQIQSYLDVLDEVFDRATALYEKPEQRRHRLTYRENDGIMQVYRKGGPFHIQEDGVAFFATEKFSHHNAVLGQWTAPHAGHYRVKVSAYALRSEEPVVLSLRAGGTGHAESNHVPHVFLEHFSVKEGQPQVFEWEGWLERGHYFHVYPTSLPPMRFAGKNEEMRQHEYEGAAAVVQWVEVDGPIFEQWPPSSHRALWGDTPIQPVRDAAPNADPIAHLDEPPGRIAKPRLTRAPVEKSTGNRWIYDPKKQNAGGEPVYRNAPIPKPVASTRVLAPEDSNTAAQSLLLSFANRAYRRPVLEEEIEPFFGLVQHWIEDGSDFETAMRVGYQAIITSPGFLYHQGTLPEAASRLDDFQLAERLSFFLWNGLPDKTLGTLAEKGELSDSPVLRKQVERLLDDPRSDRFLEQFLGSWLDLDLIDFTTPDEKLYPEHDKLLQWSMIEETSAFFRHLVDHDLPAANLIDSEFAMVNWRLADHYGLPPVEGMGVRAVKLPADSPRGGIMTQASVLKVTANGTTTSPVVRGVWLLERILGVHPEPPPPGVPAIEPDIRGATSIRDQLEKHRSSESCYQCHAKIDPPGVALETFDVIGGWRDHYRALNEELADLKPRYSPYEPVPIRYVQGQPVDASYDLIDGRRFEDVEGFKKLLLADERQIARGLVEKLVIYATGAEVRFSDRSEIEQILDRSAGEHFGVRTLIREVVLSPLFQQK